jgi:hypothetical protein
MEREPIEFVPLDLLDLCASNLTSSYLNFKSLGGNPIPVRFRAPARHSYGLEEWSPTSHRGSLRRVDGPEKNHLNLGYARLTALGLALAFSFVAVL